MIKFMLGTREGPLSRPHLASKRDNKITQGNVSGKIKSSKSFSFFLFFHSGFWLLTFFRHKLLSKLVGLCFFFSSSCTETNNRVYVLLFVWQLEAFSCSKRFVILSSWKNIGWESGDLMHTALCWTHTEGRTHKEGV